MQCHLYLNIAHDQLSFVILENLNKEFVAMEYYNIDKEESFTQMRDIMYSNEMLRKSYRKVNIVYNFPESVLVPEALYEGEMNNASLDLIYGDLRSGDSLSEPVSEWNLFNTYRVPSALHQLMNQHFPHGNYWHSYSVLLKTKNHQPEEESTEFADVIFYPNKMIVALFAGGDLKLVQSFDYETAEDVSYHLLNICHQFQLDCEKIKLKVKGLIDEQSSVFTELLKYFLNIELADRPANFKYDPAFEEFPRHFFTPLFEMAQCV